MSTRPAEQRRRRGVYAIEFAFTLPLWFFLLLAVADFSWLYMHQAALDHAAAVGCRAGAIVDPGDYDTNISEVTVAATDAIQALLARYALVPMDDFVLSAHTEGAPPTRVLVCDASWRVDPAVGVFWTSRRFATRQISRLEWQREAAP